MIERDESSSEYTDFHPELNEENGSITNLIVRNRGFKSLEQGIKPKLMITKFEEGHKVTEIVVNERQIPIAIAREAIFVDSVIASEDEKLKLMAYRLWLPEGKFRHIKEYLPEESLRIENFDEMIDEVMMDRGRLGNLYEQIDTIAELVDEILPLNYSTPLAKIKFSVEIISKRLNEGIGPDQIVSEKDSIYLAIDKKYKEWISEKRKKQKKEELIKYAKRENEDPRLAVIEHLFKKGLDEDEIILKTGYSRSQVRFGLSALRITKRIKSTHFNYRKTQKLRDLVFEVERLLSKNVEERASYKELARITGASEGRIKYSIHLLMLLGRTEVLSHREVRRRDFGTREKEERVEQALELYSRFYPKARIDYETIRGITGFNSSDISDATLANYYQRAARKGSVPLLKIDSYESAKAILREEGRQSLNKPVIYSILSRRYGISENTFRRAHRDIEREEDSPITLAEYYRVKKKQLFAVIRKTGNIDLVLVSKRLKINIRTARDWLVEYHKNN